MTSVLSAPSSILSLPTISIVFLPSLLSTASNVSGSVSTPFSLAVFKPDLYENTI